jgi:hypothetical protein
MSSIEELIIQKLLDDTSVSAIIGVRVFPGSIPQAEQLPAIVVNKISGSPMYSDEGEIGIDEARLQIDSWSLSYSGAKVLSRAVRACLSAYFGTTDGVESLYLSLDNERDSREGGGNVAEYRFRTTQDYLAMYRS